MKVETETVTAAPVYSIKNATATLISAFLSPVPTYVNLRIVAEEGTSAQAFDLLLEDWRDAKLTDAQGNQLAALTELQTKRQAQGDMTFSYTFLPTDAMEAYIAPTILTANNEWLVDMSQAIKLK